MKDKIIKLKNGGVLIYSKNKLNKSFALEVGFKVGSIADKKPGTAHLLEHTLFKKTKNRSNSEVENDRNCITFINAETSMDYLILKLCRTNKLVNESFELAQDILLNSVIDDEYLETEKGVIVEELNGCLETEKSGIYSKNTKQAVSGATFGSDIIGKTKENILNIEFKDLVEFKNEHFIGNNFVASIVASFSPHKAKKLINKYFVKQIPYRKNYKRIESYFDTRSIDKDSSLQIYKTNQDMISVIISLKLNANEVDIYSTKLNYYFLIEYLSGGYGELFLKLRNKGLIYRFKGDSVNLKNESLINIVFESSKEKIKSILDIVADEIHKLTTEKLDNKLIDTFKKDVLYYYDERIPKAPKNMCHLILNDYLSFGKTFCFSRKQKMKYANAVSPEGVCDAANEIFNKNSKIFVSIKGNIEESDVPDLEYFKEKFLISEKPL